MSSENFWCVSNEEFDSDFRTGSLTSIMRPSGGIPRCSLLQMSSKRDMYVRSLIRRRNLHLSRPMGRGSFEEQSWWDSTETVSSSSRALRDGVPNILHDQLSGFLRCSIHVI